MAQLSRPLRWTIVHVDFNPVRGHEQGGERRALVVSYEPFHQSGLATVCPVTAARSEPRYPGDVPISAGEAGQTKPGVIVCSQIRTVSHERIGRETYGRVIDPATRSEVRRAIAHHLGLDVPPALDGAAGPDE